MRFLTCNENDKVISIRLAKKIVDGEVQCDTGELKQLMTTTVVYDDVEQPVLDEFGNETYEDGEPIVDEEQNPVLDGEGNPTYEQLLITETVQVPRDEYTFEDDPAELVILADLLIEKQKKETLNDIQIATAFDITAEVESLKLDYTDLCEGIPVILKSDLLSEITVKDDLLVVKDDLLTEAEADAEKFLNIVLESKGVW